MNVLSLFDGISCGRVALEKAGFKINKYYSSEIDKYAIAIAKYHYPDNIELGDIRNISGKDLKNIDLLIGGSPCNNFSFAGRKEGMIAENNKEITTLDQYLDFKKAKVKFKGESYLFWEYVRILQEVKPKFFLLENVKMFKKWENVINEALKIKPIVFNSSLVSGQNRLRLYWTNIPFKNYPKESDILLKHILQDNIEDKYFINKSYTITNLNKKNMGYVNNINYDVRKKIHNINYKAGALTKHKYYFILDNLKLRILTPIERERLQTLPDDYTKYGILNNKTILIPDIRRFKVLGNCWTVEALTYIFKGLKGLI